MYQCVSSCQPCVRAYSDCHTFQRTRENYSDLSRPSKVIYTCRQAIFDLEFLPKIEPIPMSVEVFLGMSVHIHSNFRFPSNSSHNFLTSRSKTCVEIGKLHTNSLSVQSSATASEEVKSCSIRDYIANTFQTDLFASRGRKETTTTRELLVVNMQFINKDALGVLSKAGDLKTTSTGVDRQKIDDQVLNLELQNMRKDVVMGPLGTASTTPVLTTGIWGSHQ